MRFGFHFLDFTQPGEPQSLAGLIRDSARTAEESGASWFSVMDHYFQMEHFQTAHDPMLEGYTTLGFLAGVTERMKLGTIVTGVTYRHPALLAKIVTTLDVLSGGRAFLGLGAAWYEREHLALGVPYPPISERFERLEEALQIALQMWSDDEGPFEGKHYRLAETISRRLTAATALWIARALASVPPPVKTTVEAGAAIRAATSTRACSIRARAARPAACTDDGLPTVPSAWATAAAASGRTRVVALWSR